MEQEGGVIMGCGGCQAARDARKGVSADGKKSAYRVTWGDGVREDFDSLPGARMAMGAQSDPAKRRAMRMTAVRV